MDWYPHFTFRRFVYHPDALKISVLYLTQFSQPDSIIPDPYNPLDWNRYGYARSNPVKNVDPSGHFTDEAIQSYLQNTYGDEWEKIWKGWLEDQAWMDVLHGAQAGDFLSNVWFDSSGNAQMGLYIIAGKGDQVLSGLGGTGSPGLNTIYQNSAGIGVIRSDADRGFIEIGTVGNIGITVNKVSRTKALLNYFLVYGGLAVLGFAVPEIAIPFGIAGLGPGGYQAGWPETATMGMSKGDITVEISVFYATAVDGMIVEGVRTTWALVSRAAYLQIHKTTTQVYNPHRPY